MDWSYSHCLLLLWSLSFIITLSTNMADTDMCEMCTLLNTLVSLTTELSVQLIFREGGMLFELKERQESELDERLTRLEDVCRQMYRFVHRLPAHSAVRARAESVKRILRRLLEDTPLYADNVSVTAVLEEVDRFLPLAEDFVEQEKYMCSNFNGGRRTLGETCHEIQQSLDGVLGRSCSNFNLGGRGFGETCDEILQQFVGGDLPTARHFVRDFMVTKAYGSTWESMPALK